MKTNAPLVDCFTFCFPPPFLFLFNFYGKKNYIFLAFYIVLVLQPKFLTKEQRVAEALKKRQEMADLQRQKMDEERKKQIEFMKASKESMSMTELSNFTSVFVYSRM